MVRFGGVVRNHDGGQSVERLNYTAHPTAHRVLADVVAKLVAEHSGDDRAEPDTPVPIWAARRVGALKTGDHALVCAVAAAHRGQALAVCSELVDRINEQAPIWKEQFFTTAPWNGRGRRLRVGAGARPGPNT